MSVMFRFAPALLTVGLVVGSSDGQSAANCLTQAAMPALPGTAHSIPMFARENLLPGGSILLASEDCTTDCAIYNAGDG